jgi:hypothetical protein
MLSLEVETADKKPEVADESRSGGQGTTPGGESTCTSGHRGGEGCRVLVLDTGATNHMSISRTAFKDLHTAVYDNYSVGACTFHEVAAWTQRSSYSTKSVLWYGRANSEIHNSKWKNN